MSSSSSGYSNPNAQPTVSRNMDVSSAEPNIMSQLDALLKTLQDHSQRDDLKLKALQDISDNFELLCTTQAYPSLMNSLIVLFIRLLSETVPQFIGENNTQQLRKLMLELLNRMPCNDYLKQYAKPLNTTLFKIIQNENEENVLIAIRILLELLKTFRPPFTADVSNFLTFCKNLYRDLQLHIGTMFEPRQPIRVNEIRELDIENALSHAFSVTPIQTAHKLQDSNVVYTLLPRGKQSLKVLSDLPLIIVLLYQIHRPSVQQDIADFIPLILNVISACPSPQHRNDPNFNRELFIEFLCAQVKALSFLAFLTRIYFDLVNMHASSLVKGIVQLLELCPPEVCHLRRELLVACRHLMGSDLRPKFIPYLGQFFNETVVIGHGWTCNENLRPLVFSTLADLVHHVRQQLPLQTLAQAIHLFSRCLHDPTLPGYVQAMCGKLILNLSECVAKQQDAQISDLLFFLLEVFTRKFKSVAKHMVPALKQKCIANANEAKRQRAGKNKGETEETAEEQANEIGADEEMKKDEEGKQENVAATEENREEENEESSAKENQNKGSNGLEGHTYGMCAVSLMSITDCRGLVKVLVCGAKTTTWAIMTQSDDSFFRERSRESVQFSRLLKFGLEALDIYTLIPGATPSTYVCSPSSSNVRSKEEKETLDHLSSVFTMLPLSVFKEIFTTHMEFLVERISNNYALQIVVNQFLVNAATSTTFASILVTYLIEHMHLLGTNSERANLYVKLFKLLFNSVSFFPTENEQMLKPHLHTIVNRSMQLSLTAREPINYFILLRSLFRSIGGGSHDLLYQEFLPLLPSLLQVLNRLQSGAHRQHMRELFVELCLTVPVRLSSLLPYLPLLMDPLVSALKGSPSLVQQGLRTLELCVDNLQPEFLYEHIAPVRAPLMQALWKTVTSADPTAPTVALRILGKFGGSNRKMLTDPQTLNFRENVDAGNLCVQVNFVECKSNMNKSSCSGENLMAMLPLEFTIEQALSLLHTVTVPSNSIDTRRNAWLVVKAFLSSAFSTELNCGQVEQVVNAWKESLAAALLHRNDIEIAPATQAVYKCEHEGMRHVYRDALTAMFFAVWSKDLRNEVVSFFNAVVRNLTIQAILEETGKDYCREHQYRRQNHMDSCVLIDAVVCALADSGKEYCHSAVLGMTLIVDTTAVIIGDRYKACRLPFIEYMVDQVHLLCYRSAWYARLGGCAGIKFVLDKFPADWIKENVQKLLLALLQVLTGLYGEVSSGAVDMAKTAIDDLIKIVCESMCVDENQQIPRDVSDTVKTCYQLLFSSNTLLREECQSIMQRLNQHLSIPLTTLLEIVKDNMHANVQQSIVNFMKLSCETQIGFIEGFAYVTNLNPPLYNFDCSEMTMKKFCDELVMIVETDDNQLSKRACYERKTLTRPATGPESLSSEFKTLKCAALKALSALYVNSTRKSDSFSSDGKSYPEKLILTVFHALTVSTNTDLHETAFLSLKEALGRKPLDSSLHHSSMRPVLVNLNDRPPNLSVAKRLLYLTKLSPNTFNEKLCDSVMMLLNKWLDLAVNSQSTVKNLDPFLTEDLLTGATLIDIIGHIPATSMKFVEQLVDIVIKSEQQFAIEIGSNLREPLANFLSRFPNKAVVYFLQDNNRNNEAYANLLVWLIKKGRCDSLRQILMDTPHHLTSFFNNSVVEPVSELLGLRLVYTLSCSDATWLGRRADLVHELRQLWNNPQFATRFTPVDNSDPVRFKAPRLVVKSLLSYFDSDRDRIDLLFDLCRCFVGKWIADFQFLRIYLENEVIPKFAIEWRRQAFFALVQMYEGTDISRGDTPQVQLMVKVLQYLIIPSLEYSFRQAHVQELVGTPPAPDGDSSDNIISVFSTRIIDKVPQNKTLPDGLHILLYQLSCMFVEFAAPHIHDATSKRQGSRLRRFMLFAWPCLQQNNVQDPTTKYTGHLLIALIIDKFAINRKIVLQVFHSLLKAHGQDPKPLIKTALNILTPAVPLRMDDGNTQLTQFAKKIITEDGHTPAQLVHLLQLIVRHYRVYFSVRHNLIQYLMNGIQKLVTQASSVDNRKLAVDVCEMIIKWELCRLNDAGVDSDCQALLGSNSNVNTTHPDAPMIDVYDTVNQKQFDKAHVDSVVNFLVRMACQVPDQTQNNSVQATQNAATVEALNKRCLQLLKVALKLALWGNVTSLKLQWMEKILLTEQSQHVGAVHICLDVLNFLIGCLTNEQVGGVVRQVQKGVASCLSCTTTAVVRSMYTLLTSILAILKPNIFGAIPELDHLSTHIFKFITETLQNYDKASGSQITSLYGSMTTLRAMCTAVPEFLDKVIGGFVRALVKLTREHASSISTDGVKNASDMISLCLELIRPRIDYLSVEHRKQIVSHVLVPLAERSNNDKILAVIIKIADEWLRTAERSENAPVMRERHLLLFKLMNAIERKGPEAVQLQKSFLQTVVLLYQSKNTALRSNDVTARLEPAFHLGLAHTYAPIRKQFFEIYDSSICKHPCDRLWYIMCMQNWEPMHKHYWIKQCIQILLSVADKDSKLKLANGAAYFGRVDAKSNETAVKMEVDENVTENDRSEQIRSMVEKQGRFWNEIAQTSLEDFIEPMVLLCHEDSNLAHHVWVTLLSSLWNSFAQDQREVLSREVVPFLCSGSHLEQKDCKPSTLTTFVEAFSVCQPPVHIKPDILAYLGKNHSCWHRAILLLEDQAANLVNPTIKSETQEADLKSSEKIETLEALSTLYKTLAEPDLWVHTWQKRHRFAETSKALTLAQQGCFSHALKVLEDAMTSQQTELNEPTSQGLPPQNFAEMKLWENEWIRCAKELNQWDALKAFATSNCIQDPFIVMDCAWRLPDWRLMRDAVLQVEACCPPEEGWKLHLYRGFVSVCQPDEPMSQSIDKCSELANNHVMQLWRRLPAIISTCHVPLLQAAQRAMELTEAYQLTTSLQPSPVVARSSNLHDVKAVVKTWRNRSPTNWDHLSHWYDVLGWRLHHYLNMLNVFEASDVQNSVLPMHACASLLVQVSKVARKQNQLEVALNILTRLHTMPNLPTVDAFLKMYQQVKCALKLAEQKVKTPEADEAFTEGLEIIEQTNVTYLNKEQSSKLYALKGSILAKLNRYDDANKAFSASLQLHDSLPRCWALWGEYMERMYDQDMKSESDIPENTSGLQAMVCYLQAARQDNEQKARKHLNKAIWILKSLQGPAMRNENLREALQQALRKHAAIVPPINFVPWIYTLLLLLRETAWHCIAELLKRVGDAVPQAFFYQARLFLTQQQENDAFQAVAASVQAKDTPSCSKDDAATMDLMDRTKRLTLEKRSWQELLASIMGSMRHKHPVEMQVLDTIHAQLKVVAEKQSWCESALKEIRCTLKMAFAEAFENRNVLPNYAASEKILRKISSIATILYYEPTQEECIGNSDAIRFRLACHNKFKASLIGTNNRLHMILEKLVEWERTLHVHLKQYNKSVLLKDYSEYLTAFSSREATINTFSELSTYKTSQYGAKIARFLPKMDILVGHGLSRIIWIRGHDGKKYSFSMEYISGNGSVEKQMRVDALFRIVNTLLFKDSETARRCLQISNPRSVALDTTVRLVECRGSCISMMDILQEICDQTNKSVFEIALTYYQRLLNAMSRVSQPLNPVNLLDIFHKTQQTLPNDALKSWAAKRYTDPTHLFTFRKQLVLHLSVMNVLEWALSLSSLGPEHLHIDAQSGFAYSLAFQFDLQSQNDDVNLSRPVPFRITPCLAELIGWSKEGQLAPAMVAVARCLHSNSASSMVKSFLYDEHEQSGRGQTHKSTVAVVNRTTQAIHNRLQSLAAFEHGESKVMNLIAAACSPDNLCRMDPAWFPTF